LEPSIFQYLIRSLVCLVEGALWHLFSLTVQTWFFVRERQLILCGICRSQLNDNLIDKINYNLLYRNYLKPLLDFIIALGSFIILSPIFIIVLILLFIANNGKPFFFQKRPGKDEKIFKVIKFKTMNDKKDKNGNLLPDAKRLTAVGKFIRKSSLDEIPQLLNVIKGNMSLIGPRPLLVEYLPLYSDVQKRRHEVKPGITGWAQVNGRNAISWEQKFDYDVWYVDHLSFLFDVSILFLTIKKVFKSEGINSNTAATMEKFSGSYIHE
jgi:undecaprenyl phosphate N,N'-diacetylbacillosamine 1-phosphate transferase